MRIKFIAIYLLAGAAFLGVSLWVFLSKGKNASAVRAKYKLGGMMLTAWTMFSSAACEGVIPHVTCYDTPNPEVTCYEPAITENASHIGINGRDDTDIRSGESFEVYIEYPTYNMFKIAVYAGETTGAKLIQEFEYPTEPDEYTSSIHFPVELAKTEYKGEAAVALYGMRLKEDSTVQPEWDYLGYAWPFLNIL